MTGRLTHLDSKGRARMVDVGAKPDSQRRAVARAVLRMQPETARMIRDGEVPKGDVLAVARIAGIQAAKHTWELIPLCHPIRLSAVIVDMEFQDEGTLAIQATATAFDHTGVEMEALTAAAVAGLAVYDMCKAVDRGMRVESVELLEKTGGKSDYAKAESSGRKKESAADE